MKISVIIPCYNAERWIEKCVLSAINQDYENKEIIVVDNESTDNSLNLIKRLKEKHNDLIVSSAENIYKYSWTEPVDEGLRLSSGDYITIVGADDFLDARYLSNVMKYIMLDPKKILALQSPIRSVKGAEETYAGDIGHSYKSMDDFKDQLFEKCPVTTPSVFYSKKIHENGLLTWNSEKYLGASDYDLYFRLADNNIFIYPAPKWLGYYYRWHDKQATWGMHSEKVSYDNIIKKHWKEKWDKSE